MTEKHLPGQDAPVDALAPEKIKRPSWIIGLAGPGFILLQSACVAFMAISRLRLLIGIGSLAAATTSMHWLDSILHGKTYRLAMVTPTADIAHK